MRGYLTDGAENPDISGLGMLAHNNSLMVEYRDGGDAGSKPATWPFIFSRIRNTFFNERKVFILSERMKKLTRAYSAAMTILITASIVMMVAGSLAIFRENCCMTAIFYGLAVINAFNAFVVRDEYLMTVYKMSKIAEK